MIDLTRDGIDWDPYGTWTPAEATDVPDGLPDIAIVPLVETLRRNGIVTLQSCAGHVGSDDGGLWVAASTVSEPSVRRAANSGAFERVARMIHPWQQWAFRWLPENFDEAETALLELERAEDKSSRVTDRSKQGGVVTGIQVHMDPPARQLVPVPVPYCPRCGAQYG